MIEFDVPESLADFIEGRVPKTIGAKRCMVLMRQSSEFYLRFDEHVEGLRR
jgi:intergrase/recombinase